MVRQVRLTTVVVTVLIGCAFLLLGVGCAGVGSEAPQKEQGSSPQATESEGEARCQGTRTFQKWRSPFTTNDLPGCPHGGLLLGTDERDALHGLEGDDEMRGLGGEDSILGGPGNDIIYAGDGNEGLLIGGKGEDVIHAGDGKEHFLGGGEGEDVIYGGDGNDILDGQGGDDGQRDKLYCGEGKDGYLADKNDFVDSSCENKLPSNYFFA